MRQLYLVLVFFHLYSRCGRKERAEDNPWPVFPHISGRVMFVAGKVYQEFGLFGGQFGKTVSQNLFPLFLKMLAKSLQRQVGGKAFHQFIKQGLCTFSVTTALQNADKQVCGAPFLRTDG